MTAPAASRGFTDEAIAELISRRNEPEWMRERRRQAWEAYQSIPMPTLTDEEWRRTDLRRLKLGEMSPYSSGSATTGTLVPAAERNEAFSGFMGLRDGQRVEYRLSDEAKRKGVIFTDMVTAVREHADLVRAHFMTRCVPATDSKFAALHGAFWTNGTFVYVPRHVTLDEPLRVIVEANLASTSSLSHTLIVLDEGAAITYAEDFVSSESKEAGLSTRVIEIIAGQGTQLRYVSSQRLGRGVWDFHTERALLGKESTVVLQTIELGGRVSKGRVETILEGDGASAKMLGLYVEDGSQHFDRYTLQDHRAQAGVSDLLYKGVLAGKSRSIFSGMIKVHPEGRQTAAYQQNRNLLLSRGARADSIPNLEIAASDIVGCSHGATVGKVDEEQLFYLMCRGLSRTDATRLIVAGFVDPILESVPIAALRESLRTEVHERVEAVEF